MMGTCLSKWSQLHSGFHQLARHASWGYHTLKVMPALSKQAGYAHQGYHTLKVMPALSKQAGYAHQGYMSTSMSPGQLRAVHTRDSQPRQGISNKFIMCKGTCTSLRK